MKGKQKKEVQEQPEQGTTVALYARVSTEKQDVDLSVSAQLRALRDYAEKSGFTVIGEYIDEAESGRIAERPQFRRMITDATGPNAPFKEILVWKFSRFTRKREHAVAFKSMLRRKGIKVVSITEHADDTPTGKLMEAIIESVDEFYSENLAQEVLRGMREAASRGFWMGNYAPHGYKRVHVDDGGKKRPKLALNEATAPTARHIFDLALRGKTILEITKELNAEGSKAPRGGKWSKTSIQKILVNEAYAGTLVWGANTRDGLPPVRIDNAIPAIISKEEFARVKKLLASRSSEFMHPWRVVSPYLLSGILKCNGCGKLLSAHESKGGRYTYYVCQSLLKEGSGSCDTPRLNSKRLEVLMIQTIRENILTESSIHSLVRTLDEEMDGAAKEHRNRVEAIDEEIAEANRKLDRIWHLVETTDLDMADAAKRIKEHKADIERLELSADEARTALAERRAVLDRVGVIADYAKEMGDFLRTSEVTETRAFIRSFVKEIRVSPGRASIFYTIPMPADSPINGMDTQEMALPGSVMNKVRVGAPKGTRTPVGGLKGRSPRPLDDGGMTPSSLPL